MRSSTAGIIAKVPISTSSIPFAMTAVPGPRSPVRRISGRTLEFRGQAFRTCVLPVDRLVVHCHRHTLTFASAPSHIEDSIDSALSRVQKWVEDRNYKGYDPGDGLTSWLRPLTCGNLFAERLLQQAIWKSPINLRPWVGIKPLDSTKGRGFMAWATFFGTPLPVMKLQDQRPSSASNGSMNIALPVRSAIRGEII
jgi:hypothetical protein